MNYFVIQHFHIKTITLAHGNHDTIWMFKKRKIYSTIAVPKCIATVDHVGSRFWYCLLMLLGKL
jgi:hypothetical protein